MIKLKKNKVTTLKIMPPKVSALPISQVNSGNSNSGGTGGGSNNAVNAGGTGQANGTNYISAQMYFPWYMPPSLPEDQALPKKPSDGKDGLDCKSCKDYYSFAESNQEDGAFICFKCRNGY